MDSEGLESNFDVKGTAEAKQLDSEVRATLKFRV